MARPLCDERGKPIRKGGGPVFDAPLRTKMFRQGYCSARLQTLDGATPGPRFTVVYELGHGSPAIVNRVYGHLGMVRHRVGVVEFRVGQHQDAKLADGRTVAAHLAPLAR